MTNLFLSGLLAFTMGMVTPTEIFEQEYTDYRQTYYTVAEGEFQVGAREQNGRAINLNNPNIKIIDNQVMYNDDDYGYVPIVAINWNEVLDSQVGKYDCAVYGSIIEINYPDGTVEDAIVLDSCGACRYSNKIDKWINQPDSSEDVKGVSYTYKRYGWDTYKEEIESVIETVVTLEDTEMQNINVMPYVKPKDEILHERVTLH